MSAGAPARADRLQDLDQLDESLTRRRRRALAPLVAVFLSVGVSSALVGPFLTLFLTNAIHARPVQISLFLIVQPLSGIAGSTVLGRLSDGRVQRRHILMVAAAGGAANSVCLAVIRDYWVLLLVVCALSAVAGAMMAQSFAYARAVLAGDPAATMVTSTLRTFFSLAWVAGPPMASLLLSAGGFRSLYVASAGLYAVVIGVAAFWLSEPTGNPALQPASDGKTSPNVDAPRRTVWLTIVGIAVIQSALSVNVQALPLHVRQDLHGSVGASGLILGLCAALEIPAMLGFGFLSTRFSLWSLVRLGPLFGMVYFVVAATAHQVWQLAAVQLLNACFIAIISGLAISYVQELLPTQPGRASTLYSNAFPCGVILASPVLGLGATYGYRVPYATGVGLSLVGLVLLTTGARSGRRSEA